jgi:transglutaminase-like putative cysteine protease
VYEIASQVRLQPASGGASPQICHDFTLTVEPFANIFHYVDYYGNIVHYFNILSHCTHLEIKAISKVETGSGRMASGSNEAFTIAEYLVSSTYVNFASIVENFADQFNQTLPPFQLAEKVCHRIQETLNYEKGVTNVHSTVAEVLELGGGVCQDFAHVMIAVCRKLGVPARYVSGYIFDGALTQGNEGASHAWCEVYGGEDEGWLAFDATRSTAFVDERYIRIGHGRDYSDIPPVRGTYRGIAKEELAVSVLIARLPDEEG